MNFPIHLLLFQEPNNSGLYLPLWVAIIGLAGVVLAPIVAAYVTARFARTKTALDLQSQKLDNQKSLVGNSEFKNDAFNKAQTLINSLQKTNIDLTVELHQKERQLTLKELEMAEANGAKKEVIQERDLIGSTLLKLQTEHAECLEHNKKVDKDILDCHKDSQVLNDRLNILVGLLKENNFACPENFKWILEPVPLSSKVGPEK